MNNTYNNNSMTKADIQSIIIFLQERVLLDKEGPDNRVSIKFIIPTQEEMKISHLNEDLAQQILSSDWCNDMTNDIIETPEFCDPDDSPQQILKYAKDVAAEYIMKRVLI